VDKKAAAILVSLVLASPLSAEPLVGTAVRRSSRGVVFETALASATEKLASPACRLVLSDFRDASGVTLAEKLSEAGLSAPEFLARLDYRDGRNAGICHRRHFDAFTAVGGSTVWTCPGGSLSLGGENTRGGANTLIHEMLHALGLDENPPTSQEINRRVRERCGL
jgi:hypothetical protein